MRKTLDQFKKEVNNVLPDFSVISTEYITNKTKMKFQCPKGHIFERTPKDFLRYKTCPYCTGKHKKTTNEFKQEVYNLVGNEYTVLGEYQSTHTPIKIRHNCNYCNNYEYDVKPTNFLMGKRCPKCSHRYKKTTDSYREDINKKYPNNEYTLISEYVNDKTKVKIRHNCSECNNYEFEVRPSKFLSDDNKGCPICSKKNATRKLRETQVEKGIVKTHKEFVNEVYDLVGTEYIVLGKYVNCKTLIKIMHNTDDCHHIYEVRPRDFLTKGNRCPVCSRKSSQEESELVKYIKSIYNGNIIENDRSVLNGKELDIYLPDIKLAIEYDGLYWHSEQGSNGKCDKNYHLNKTIECEEKGIQLIHIFSDEWINKNSIVKSKLAHIIGCDKNPKIYARNCYIKEINDKNIKNEFLEKNHIQGKYDSANLILGLYTKDEDKLVSIMTFRNEQTFRNGNKSNSTNIELARFASDINFIVIGAYTKLLKYFINNYEFDKLITFADRRWSKKDNIYNNSDLFKFVSESKPSYYYLDDSFNKRYNRSSFTKQKIKTKFPDIYDDNLSETEIMINKLYYKRIYDCGNLKYEFAK